MGDPTCHYNCAADAFGDHKRWWWPGFGTHWPKSMERNDDTGPDTLMRSLGAEVEPVPANGVVPYKLDRVTIAMYRSHGAASHFMRELPDGRWSSKCGARHHLVVDNVRDFEGNVYGKADTIYRLPVKAWRSLRKM